MKFFLSGLGLLAILFVQNAQAMIRQEGFRQYREEIAQARKKYSEQAEKEPDYERSIELYRVYAGQTRIKEEQEYRAELELRRKRNSPEDQEWLRLDRNMWILARH